MMIVVSGAAELFLMIVNAVVIEMGGRGMWQSSGSGVSPWYPVAFIVLHVVLWLTVVPFLSMRKWVLVIDTLLVGSFVLYNLNAFREILYVS